MSTPAFWQQAWDDAQPQLEAIRHSLRELPLIPARTLRVGQLDAELLDQELLQLLKEPISKALGLVSGGWEVSLDPEFTFILQLLLYKYSVWSSGATYGAKLQSLRYKSSRSGHSRWITPSGIPARILGLHAVLSILLPYVHKRVRIHALSNAWPDAPSSDRRRRLWDALLKLESTHTTLSLLNFIIFLWNGRHRTVADRILGLRLIPSSALLNRNVSYEFMNRQMVWHAFTEFLLFLLPIINTRSMRRKLSKNLSKIQFSALLPQGLRVQPPNELVTITTTKRGRYFLLPENQCAICAEDASMDLSLLKEINSSNQQLHANPTVTGDKASEIPAYPINTPYKASCGHVYCYVCIADRLLRAVDEGENYWECLRCDEKVYNAGRWELDRYHLQPSGDSVDQWRGAPSYGHDATESEGSELSGMDFDSVSSIGLRTYSGSGDLSG